MRYVALLVVYVGVTAYCLSDVLSKRENDVYGLPKLVWVAVILLFPYVGAAAYLVMKFRNRPGPTPDRGPRQVPPDEDPEFLSWLKEQERRRKERDD